MSDLRQRIETARDRLQSQGFSNEASISTGIVLPILDALGWDAFNPHVVAPEFRVRNRRVDFALIANGSPSVFVEVKQPGLADGADKQLFEYAFHEGVPLAVLTDGATWSIYVPSEQGSYEDRRAYHLDLAEREPDDSAERLRRYLDRDAVASGSAIGHARRDCQRAKQRKGALAALPQAWANLVADEDAALLDRLVAEVESASGYQPERQDLLEFVRSLSPASGVLPAPKSIRKKPARPSTAPLTVDATPSTSDLPERGFALNGRFTSAKNGADLLTGVFKALSAADATFLDRFAERPHGRTRRYLAKDRDDLFPGHPELRRQSREVGQGYWLSTHSSNAMKMNVLKLAADVAGIRLGDELQVRFEK